MSAVAGTSYDPTFADVVVRGIDGALWTRRYTHFWGAGWDPTWTKVPNSEAGPYDPRGFATTTRKTATNQIDIVARRPAPDEQHAWTERTDTNWTNWTALGAP
jgi:hypothetical protein